jgi:hypothetical protein
MAGGWKCADERASAPFGRRAFAETNESVDRQYLAFLCECAAGEVAAVLIGERECEARIGRE